MEKITEKPTSNYFVNAGIYVLNPIALDYVPVGEYLDMPDLITKLFIDGKKAAAYPLREYWLDIGQWKEYFEASKTI